MELMISKKSAHQFLLQSGEWKELCSDEGGVKYKYIGTRFLEPEFTKRSYSLQMAFEWHISIHAGTVEEYKRRRAARYRSMMRGD